MKKSVEGIVNLAGVSHLLTRKLLTLGGGERQKVALGCSLIMKPNLLLLDKPLSTLDPEHCFYRQVK